jgi:hypothetical protein
MEMPLYILFCSRYKKNELGEIVLKKSVILPCLSKKYPKQIIGKWVLIESGLNWALKTKKIV